MDPGSSPGNDIGAPTERAPSLLSLVMLVLDTSISRRTADPRIKPEGDNCRNLGIQPSENIQHRFRWAAEGSAGANDDDRAFDQDRVGAAVASRSWHHHSGMHPASSLTSFHSDCRRYEPWREGAIAELAQNTVSERRRHRDGVLQDRDRSRDLCTALTSAGRAPVVISSSADCEKSIPVPSCIPFPRPGPGMSDADSLVRRFQIRHAPTDAPGLA